jgi:hypothetical protein
MIYRKQGLAERWENGTLIEVRESGIATENGDLFECHPDQERRLPDGRTAGNLPAVAAEIESLIPDGIAIERLILTHGVADHECNGTSWREENRRVHLSLVRDETRALLDLATFDFEHVSIVAEALTRLAPERDPSPRLRLAPNVTAALIPSLVDLAPPNVRLIQTAGGIDGKGSPIAEAQAEATATWPNWYRPSYRARPVRMPLNVRIECDVTTIERDRPIAVALLAPVRGLTLRVLVDDGRSAWPATVRLARIDAVANERTWFPYGGGSFGAEMML